MKMNMGSTDRLLRAMIVAIIYILVYTGVLTGTLKVVLGLVSIVIIMTALFGVCPLYSLFGFDTCSVKRTDSE